MDPSKTGMTADTGTESESPKPRVRDRIFETACDLFYRRGIRAVGVDTIADEAGTNKMSFYRSFGSKSELVAEYLRENERAGLAWWEKIVSSHPGDARAQVEALFDAHTKVACDSTSRGCPLANAAVELTDDDQAARAVIAHHKTELRRRFRKLAREMNARDSDTLGDALMLLWEGSFLTRLTFSNRGPAQNAAKAARALVAAYTQ